MSDDLTLKDSGKRQEFATGSRRDMRDGKGRFDLLPMYAIYRLARTFEKGSVKYGDDNWRLGQHLRRYLDSALRHLMEHASGFRDEDHLAQALWNVAAMIETEKMIRDGALPAELDDRTKWTPSWNEPDPK